MSTLPTILGDARGRVIALVSSLSVAEAAATGVAAFATRDIFSALRDDGGAAPISALVALTLAGVFVAVARFGNRGLAEWLGQSYATSTRNVLFTHLSRMEQSTVEARRAGAWGLRFVGDLGSLRSWVSRGMTDLISAAIVLPGAAFALWLLNPAIAINVFIPILVSLGLMFLLMAVFDRIHRKVRSKRANIAIDMMERVNSAPQLDLMGRRQQEVRRLDNAGEALQRNATRRTALRTALRTIPDIGAVFGGTMVLWTAWRIDAPAADAAAALAVLGIIAVPLRGLAFVWDRRVAWGIACEKIEKVLAQPILRRHRTKRDGPIGFTACKLALHGLPLTLTLKAGEKIVLTGPAGGGTSSALKVLAGLDVPDTGTLTFDCEEKRRPATMLLCDDTPILHGSLRRNLTLGIRGKRPDDKTIIAATETAGLSALIGRIGLRGTVGAGGATLSRRERIAVLLVRALLADPQLLLIDLAEIAGDATQTALLARVITETDATTVTVWPRSAAALAGLRVHDIESNEHHDAAA